MSWFSKFLRKESNTGLAQQIRLRTARFRHLLGQYGQIIALGADAAEKQSGEYILDNAYILALSDKAFESAEGMVYDLNVLTGQRYIGFYDAVEALREKATALISARAATPSSALEEKEEPEYRLLREVREILFQASDSIGLPKEVSNSTLFGIVESVQEAACDSLAEWIRSFGSMRPPAAAHVGCSLPIQTIVVDLMDSLEGSNELLPIPDPLSPDSAPLRQFLAAFFQPGIGNDKFCDTAALEFASLVAFGLEDSMNAAVFHREEYGLLDAYLSCTPDSNYIYCRFSCSTGLRVIAAGILTRLGFSVSRTQLGVTGWLASQPAGETTAKLKALGKMAAFLLQPPSAGIQFDGTEDDVDRFFQVHD